MIMRKLLILIILLAIILSANGQGFSKLVVIIDPGHGGGRYWLSSKRY